MPDDTSTAVVSLEVGVAHEEGSHLGLDGLGEQSSRPIAENFCERVHERPWLDELDDAIVGHGVSSFGGEVAGLCTATIRRLHPFTPSPTSAHSSSVVRPGRLPASRAAWRTQFDNVCAVQPILAAIDTIAAHSDALSTAL